MKQVLSDFTLSMQKFGRLSEVLKKFQDPSFSALNDKQKYDCINRALFELIDQEKTPCFLLPAVVEYIEQVTALKLLKSYAFFDFELWLNQFSDLSKEQNYLVRAKIMGRWLPREAFQLLFPIGMDKTYPGPHFVTAHGSPDLDTTISSFWGWVDAFTARVSEGLHFWNVPGGPPTGQAELSFLFKHVFGKDVFAFLSKTRTTLALSGIDLMTQKGFTQRHPSESTLKVEHEPTRHAVAVVDDKGYYLGDWRSLDIEGVRHVVMMMGSCLRWFANDLHLKFISLFAEEKLSASEFMTFIQKLFLIQFRDFGPIHEFTASERKDLEVYFIKVLGLEKGLDATIKEFAGKMAALSVKEFVDLIHLLENSQLSALFDPSGQLIENRQNIFKYLQELIAGLDRAIHGVRNYIERLDLALGIKTHVFGKTVHHISYRADIDEIKAQMGDYPYLSVTMTDQEGRLIPLGIVYAQDLHKPILGTVTLRDFCNREETKIPPYFEIISVIDHHKSTLQTNSAPMALIADAQSVNVLCAELSFALNDRFGLGGMSLQQIDKQIEQLKENLERSESKRLLQLLLQKRLTAEQTASFFVDPRRETLEYMHFLYGILDDTDLLTKVSRRDVECVAQLINRLKSLFLGQAVEVISFSDLNQDPDFVKKAAARILDHPDMHSLYHKLYLAKEEAVEESMAGCVKGDMSSFYADTKEQNGCARVGQTKLFARNHESFAKHLQNLRQRWYDYLLQVVRDNPELDLHLQMISTIAAGETEAKPQDDELWIWIPFTEQSVQHLKNFLNGFLASLKSHQKQLSVEFYGNKAKEYEQIFAESGVKIPHKAFPTESLPIAVLKYPAGLVNSRKAMISPYLPKLV